ncbi:TPA: minor capsid protein [Streptococcus suis]|nr:minor capsid protein [Streptococcus suis]
MASDYWKKRIRAEQLAKMERGATLGEEMDRLYSYHFNELEKEIRAFEQRYADKNGLSLAEVKARVDDFDVKAFEEKAKRYVAEKNFSARANSELALYNLKMKTNRLALLQYNLDLELIALAEDERNLTERFLSDEFVKAIETQSGLLGRSVLSASQIGTTAQAILNTPFHGANWSDNIWKRQTALREVVARMIERLLLQGKNPTTMVAQLRKEFNVTASEAKRLAVTEGARVATEGQKQAYIANGYDEYEFIAEPSACRECAKLDGKIFKVKDMEPGENAAPMHPWCHCSTGANYSLDREAPNGVWGEDKQTEAEGQKQITGNSRKLLEINDESDIIKTREGYNYIKGEASIQKAIADFGKISDAQADLIYEERRGDGGGYIKTTNSFKINRALRPGGSMDILTDDDWDVMAALDEVIESNVTPYNIRGLRKVSYDYLDSFLANTDVPKGTSLSELAENINNLNNHTYFELAYSSVSIDPDKNVFENRRIWLDIEVPKGTNAYMSSNLMESEFILGTGTTFELKGSSVAQDKYGDLLKITLKVKEK